VDAKKMVELASWDIDASTRSHGVDVGVSVLAPEADRADERAGARHPGKPGAAARRSPPSRSARRMELDSDAAPAAEPRSEAVSGHLARNLI
jgi:hypothetical protein